MGKKLEDIHYSGRISTKRVTELNMDFYFLVVDLTLRAETPPSELIPVGKTEYKFELPISQEKYNQLQRPLDSSGGFLRLSEGALSLSQGEELENRLRVNKAYLSAQKPKTADEKHPKLPSKKLYRGSRGHSSGLFSVKDL